MPRLPVDQGDPEEWGALLNEFLSVAHNTDGSIKLAPEQYGMPLASGECSHDRRFLGSAGSGASGDLQLTYFTATKTEAITQLAMYTAGTAMTTPTLVRFAVYSAATNGNLTLLASTVNDTALLAASATRYIKALSSTWSKTAGARYAVGFLSVAASVSSVYGASDIGTPLADTIWGREPRLSGKRSGQSDLPASINSGDLTDTRRNPFVECLP
jgi:hypothetical protein